MPAPTSSAENTLSARLADQASDPRSVGVAAVVAVLVNAGARLSTVMPSIAATGSRSVPSRVPVSIRPHAVASTLPAARQSAAVASTRAYSRSVQLASDGVATISPPAPTSSARPTATRRGGFTVDLARSAP
jgi:hypothetical protein